MNKKLIAARWLLIMLMVISLAVWSTSIIIAWHKQQIEAFVSEPASYETVPDEPRAQFAKALQLEQTQQHELALKQLTLVLGSNQPELMSRAYFNRGNINLREALTMTASDARQIPLIELAKQDYRSALALNADFWEARYNLEVALRIVPEDPETESEFDKKIIDSERSIESKAFKVDLP